MRNILDKLIKKETVSDIDIEMALFSICDENHDHCNIDCPVFMKLKGKKCRCFKNGHAMLKCLRKGAK